MMHEAQLTLDGSDVIGTTDPRLFGAFVEHLEAVNTKDATPVAPAVLDAVAATDGGLRLTLPPASWNVVRLKVGEP